jgi:methionyl-tRNA synthetase
MPRACPTALAALVALDEGAGDVTYTQFMGKDNVPFHTLGFPATIIGSGEPWKLVDYHQIFNYLTYDGGSSRTSQGRGVFMDQALSILPADYWRWSVFAIIAQPFVPEAAAKVLDGLGVPKENRNWPDAGNAAALLDALPRGLPIKAPEVLFARVEDTWIAEQAERFGGGV